MPKDLNLFDYDYFAKLTFSNSQSSGTLYIKDFDDFDRLMFIAIGSGYTDFKLEINPEITKEFKPWEIIP